MKQQVTPISHLLVTGRAPDAPLAMDFEGASLSWASWVALVEILQQRILHLEQATAASGHPAAWGVYCEDAAHAGAALFALWQLDKVAWLPGNVTAETVGAIDQTITGWISDVVIPTGKPVISPIAALATASTEGTEGKNAGHQWQVLSTDTVLLYVFTSGSTGEPKAIPKTLAQLQAELDNLEALWGDTLQSTRLLSSVSHQHVYGLLFRLLWPLSNGTVFVRQAIQYPEQWFALTQRLHAATWVASPALYKRLQALLPWSTLREHVRQMFCSGGPLPAENALFLAEELQHPVIEVLGSSETGGIAWRHATTADAPWTPFNGVNIDTAADGALMIRSPYLPDDAPYAMADRVELRDDGKFALRGRLDRIVKIEEKRVSLPQLEQHLAQHPWVKEAHITPVTREHGRQSLGAVVVLRNDFPLTTVGTRKQLTDALKQHMALLCETVIVPKKWRFVPEMPANAQGKLTSQAVLPLFTAETRILLPEILVRETVSETETRFALCVPARLAHFEGHFREAPILPGVVQVDWAMQLGQACWSLPEAFSDLEVLKFQRVVTPLQILHLSLRYDTARQKLYFQLHSSKGPHASGRIVFKAAPQADREEA